jgi:2-oxoglutarate ferredoxin oxidoreductase subunit alpha
MAEKYQLPVIFLSDQSLSHRTETLIKPEVKSVTVEERWRPDAEMLANGYKRYLITPSGVSPMSVPGTKMGEYVAPGLEHDESADILDPVAKGSRIKMHSKRFQKLATAQRELDTPQRYGPQDADIGVIGWGSTEGAIQEAVDRALAKGIKVAAVHPKVLMPLPEQDLSQFISSVKRLMVVELNYTGQFARYLRSILGSDYILVNKYNGMPFTAGEIYQRIEEAVAGEHRVAEVAAND